MSSELKVGMLFLVVLVLGLTFTVFTTPSLRKKGAYEVTFPRVQRLKAGDPVTYNGVRVGSVSTVDPVLKADGSPAVAVVFSVDTSRQPNVLVGQDTKYTIRQGILGGAELEILSQNGVPITPELAHQATGAEPIGVDEALSSVQRLVEENRSEVQRAIKALREGMDNFSQMSIEIRLAVSENRDQLKKTIRNIGDAADTIDQTVAENRDQIRAAVLNFKTMAGQIGDMVAENREQVKELIERVSNAGSEVGDAAHEIKETVVENRPALKKTIDNAAVISEQIAKGQGSLGKLVMDDTAHDKLETTLDAAQQRLEEIKPFTQGLSDLRFYGGIAAGGNVRSGVAIEQAYLRIEPRPWKFYEAGISYRSAGNDRDIKNDDPDKLNVDFDLQLGWRFLKDDDRQRYSLWLSGGLLESRLGMRAGWNLTDSLAFTAMARQAQYTRDETDRRYEDMRVRVRATFDYTIWDRISLSVGGDDLAGHPGLWFGARGEILDNDLRNLFAAASFMR